MQTMAYAGKTILDPQKDRYHQQRYAEAAARAIRNGHRSPDPGGHAPGERVDLCPLFQAMVGHTKQKAGEA